MKCSQANIIAILLFAALLVTFSFPYIAQADTSVNGFFRQDLVSSGVFEQREDLSLVNYRKKISESFSSNYGDKTQSLPQAALEQILNQNRVQNSASDNFLKPRQESKDSFAVN
jgi:hypothetical protein